jgi:GH24 family phage-related lysozyme (muramidase)
MRKIKDDHLDATCAPAIDFIKAIDSFSPRRYKDSNGRCKIGYGHKCEENDDLNIVTEEEAMELLYEDVGKAISQVKYLTTGPINNNQLNALIALIYDIGRDKYHDSAVRKIINMNDANFTDRFLQEAFLEHSSVRGEHTSLELLRRRLAELEMFQKPLET